MEVPTAASLGGILMQRMRPSFMTAKAITEGNSARIPMTRIPLPIRTADTAVGIPQTASTTRTGWAARIRANLFT